MNLYSPSEDYIESLFVEIKSGERTTNIETIYNPHQLIVMFSLTVLKIFCLPLIKQSKIYDLMLCSDFNIDLLNKDCKKSALFLNTMCIHCHIGSLTILLLQLIIFY